jgi:AraC-like DNA-binding protein
MSLSELTHVGAYEGSQANLERWREKFCGYANGLDVLSSVDDLSGEITKYDFAGAILWSITSRPQLIRRPRPSSGGVFRPMAFLQLSGTMRVIQEDHECHLSAGSFVFIDSAIPHELECTGDFRMVAIQFPPTTFQRGLYRLALGQKMDSHDPLNAAFYQCALNIWKAFPNIHPLRHASALSALISLSHMTTAISAAENQPETPVRVLRAMEFVENRLGDSELSPQDVADAQNVSRRYLDALFLACGHRVQTWIWERRLQRAAEDLRLNSEWNHTILHTAIDHGFKSQSHFSRTFAKRFGMPPREYRQQYGLMKHKA